MSSASQYSKPIKGKQVIGILGGIGSGKSTVASILADLGAIVLDADQCAKDLLFEPEVQKEIKNTFGDGVFGPDGHIDRKLLASRVFVHDSERAKINAIIHPRVRLLFRNKIKAIQADSNDAIIVLDVPLLLGSELKNLCDLLIMVNTPLETRSQWVQRDRQWEEDELNKRESFQPSIQEKCEAADVFIDNNGTLEELKKKVRSFFNELI